MVAVWTGELEVVDCPLGDVCFGLLAEIAARPSNVRFYLKSGHRDGRRYARRGSSGSLAILPAIRRAAGLGISTM